MLLKLIVRVSILLRTLTYLIGNGKRRYNTFFTQLQLTFNPTSELSNRETETFSTFFPYLSRDNFDKFSPTIPFPHIHLYLWITNKVIVIEQLLSNDSIIKIFDDLIFQEENTGFRIEVNFLFFFFCFKNVSKFLEKQIFPIEKFHFEQFSRSSFDFPISNFEFEQRSLSSSE